MAASLPPHFLHRCAYVVLLCSYASEPEPARHLAGLPAGTNANSVWHQEFSAIDYLSTDSKTTIAIAPQRIEQNYLYLYGYVLLHEWEAALPRTSEITADELNALACATVLGLTENQWFEVLEMLASHGICRINKQLSPFTLVRLADTQMIIPKLYTLLL